jgi:1,5-anhydro-D-fructose reductase (1,5-anhydro-D-mannitol-forming)
MTPPSSSSGLGHPTIRFGLIGFGSFAERTVLPAMREVAGIEIVALQKRSRAEAEAKARAYGVPLAFATAEELVAHPDVDAVFIVSANAAHCPETLAAAHAGKHVLVEKPMALTVMEAEQMIGACRAAGVQLMVGHLVRFSPLVRHIRDTVRSGVLGTITYARADFSYNGRMSRRGWLHQRGVAGGGPVFDIGVHCLDTLRYILDDEVVSVSSLLAPMPTNEVTEESALIGLRFAKGPLGAIFCSYAGPRRRKQLEIIGSEGTITTGDFTAASQETIVTTSLGTDANPGKTTTETIQVPSLVAEEIRDFCNAIRHGQSLESPGENGLANQRVLAAVYANAVRG